MKNTESENFFMLIYNMINAEIENMSRERSLNERIRIANKKI